jgi:hypothetical protein
LGGKWHAQGKFVLGLLGWIDYIAVCAKSNGQAGKPGLPSSTQSVMTRKGDRHDE